MKAKAALKAFSETVAKMTPKAIERADSYDFCRCCGGVPSPGCTMEDPEGERPTILFCAKCFEWAEHLFDGLPTDELQKVASAIGEAETEEARKWS